jgi:hypothetical protein
LLENANFKSPLVKVQDSEERFQLTAVIKAIDPAGSLAAQRDLPGSKKPAEGAGAAGKQPGKKP